MLLISNPFVKAFLKKEFLVSSSYNQVTEVCQMAFNTPINSQKKKRTKHPILSTWASEASFCLQIRSFFSSEDCTDIFIWWRTTTLINSWSSSSQLFSWRTSYICTVSLCGLFHSYFSLYIHFLCSGLPLNQWLLLHPLVSNHQTTANFNSTTTVKADQA